MPTLLRNELNRQDPALMRFPGWQAPSHYTIITKTIRKEWEKVRSNPADLNQPLLANGGRAVGLGGKGKGRRKCAESRKICRVILNWLANWEG